MIQEELSKLIGKLESKNITSAELERLKYLLENREYTKELFVATKKSFDEFLKVSDRLEAYPRKEDVGKRLLSSIKKDKAMAISRSRRHLLYRYLTIASIVAIVGFIYLGYFYQKSSTGITWKHVKTAYGERKQITLDDGSSILLNGNSTVHYSSEKLENIRMVKLKGEAFFKIAKSTEKPFYIISQDFVTKVVGTSFNIDTDIENAIEVNSGKVNVYAISENNLQSSSDNFSDLSQFQTLIDTYANDNVILTKGQKAILVNNRLSVFDFNSKNWHDNELVHLNESLSQVAKKAYRFYGDSIWLSSNISNSKITITFRDKNLKQVVTTLAELCDAKLIRDEKNKIWQIMKK